MAYATCPTCSTKYPLPDNVPGKGIVVIKCYTCDSKITVTPRPYFGSWFKRVKATKARP